MQPFECFKCGEWILRIISFANTLTIFTAGILLVEPATAGGTVTSRGESSLRAAMAGGGTVTFACDGTITLANTISILLNTVLDGSGHQITISGNNTVRVFYSATNVNFAVINLAIANGLSTNGAGIFNDGGALVLAETIFLSNIATNEALPGTNAASCGGAICNCSGSVISFPLCVHRQ